MGGVVAPGPGAAIAGDREGAQVSRGQASDPGGGELDRDQLVHVHAAIAELPADERGAVGKGGNEAKARMEGMIERRAAELDSSEISSRLAADAVDVTLPGDPAPPVGHLHLISTTRRRIEDIMVGLGYRVLEGPEIELDYYNFTALNMPANHPALAAMRRLGR